MNKTGALLPLALLALLLSACAGEEKPLPAQPDVVIIDPWEPYRSDSTPRILASLPPMPGPRVEQAILDYALASKAWWLDTHCHLSGAMRAEFQTQMAEQTQIIRALLQDAYAVSAEASNRYARSIGEHTRREMIANDHYGCAEKAERIWARGYMIAKKASKGIYSDRF